jgi:hypothetical protein
MLGVPTSDPHQPERSAMRHSSHRGRGRALALFCVPIVLACTAGRATAQRVTAPAASQASGNVSDTTAVSRDSLMNVVLRAIAGREQEPAESVFKNIKVLRGMPAGRIPRVMNMGFGRSLGISCSHCHQLDKWESDEKPAKQVAREMWAMMNTINTQLLANITNLKSERPTVNCTTCHRGDTKPALNLPDAR